MNDQAKTKEELVKELQKLRQEFEALKTAYEKDIIERKKTEEKLLFINKAVESSSDAIGISDAQGHHFYQNKALSDLFEYATAEELEAAGGGAAVVKDIEVTKVMFGNIMNGKSWLGELEMVTKSGRVFPAYERADAIKDNDGNIIGLIGIITDITQRKLVENELRESKIKYQAIFESTGTASLIIDEDTSILMANNECLSITGYTPTELIGQRWTQFVAPESLQKIMKYRKLRHQNPDLIPKKYEVKLVNKRGEILNVILDIGIIPNTKEMVVSILDITASRKAEEELRLSEEKYRALIEHMGEGVGFINDAEIFIYANPSAENIFGVGEGGLTGLCINDFLVDENVELVKDETQKRRQGKSSVFEHEIVLNDGSTKEILATATPSFNGNKFLGTFAIFRDITERKKMENALRASEENYRLLADSSPEMIYMIDKDGYIKYINSAAAESFHLNKNQLIGKNLTEIYPPDIAFSHYANIKQVFETKHMIHHEIEEIFLSGELWIDVKLAPLINESGDVIAVLGLSNNITDRKRAEEEIKRKNEELAKLNTEKDKFFSIIAHDLRSPFNSLLGFTELMEKELPTMTREQIGKIAATIRKSSTSLYALLENLLEWSRLQRGLIAFNPESILLLRKALADTALVTESAKKKEIEITFDIPEDLNVYADEKMLGGILRNLISNALKFTHKGGKITISAKALDNTVECSVSDSGIGMNQEMKENLFNVDVNTTRKGTDKEPSTGLGLIICRDFVEKNGGRLWVEAEEGKGSTFYFTLPSKKDESSLISR